MAGVAGRSGRKPLPTHTTDVRGTTRLARTLEGAVDGTGSLPEFPPEWMRDDQLACDLWAEVRQHMVNMGTDRQEDARDLELLCKTYSEWRSLCDALEENGGSTYETTNDQGVTMIRPHPAHSQRSECARRLQGLFSEFGMSPVGRTKITGVTKSEARRKKTDEYFEN